MPELTLPQQIARMDGERLRTYRGNLDFYNGLQWPGSARSRERRLTFNYVKPFVQKLTSYLVDGLSLHIEPWADSESARTIAQRAQEALRGVHQDNHLEQLDFDTELDAAVLGDGAYKVIWDPQEHRVRVSSPDVQGLFAWHIADDPTQVWRVASRYSLSPEEAQLLYGEGVSKLFSNKKRVIVVEAWTDRSFQIWLDDAPLRERPNPYGFIPFVLFPNLREPKQFWGTSDIPILLEPARELNRAISQLSTILELSGNPIAVLEGIEQAQDITVQPGAVWELPEKARAYLLDLLQGGGVQLHIDFINLLYRTLHDLSETPRIAFGDNSRSLSGVALEMEAYPLQQKIRRKRLIRTAVYQQRAHMALRILEQRTGQKLTPVQVQVQWGSILPQDRGRLVRDEQVLVQVGLHSRRRAMANLGIPDPDAELHQLLAEQQEALAKSTNGRSPNAE